MSVFVWGHTLTTEITGPRADLRPNPSKQKDDEEDY